MRAHARGIHYHLCLYTQSDECGVSESIKQAVVWRCVSVEAQPGSLHAQRGAARFTHL